MADLDFFRCTTTRITRGMTGSSEFLLRREELGEERESLWCLQMGPVEGEEGARHPQMAVPGRTPEAHWRSPREARVRPRRGETQ